MKNRFEIFDEYVVIYIKYRGQEIESFVDIKDFEKLNNIGVSLTYNISNGVKYVKFYIIENGRKKQIYLHRYLVNAKKDMVVDHINHNTFDNRKLNLRMITQKENTQNLKGSSKSNQSSDQVSVTKMNGRTKQWIVSIRKDGDIVFKRYFFSKEEAEHIAKHARAVYLPFSCEARELDVDESKKILEQNNTQNNLQSQSNNKHSKIKNIDWMPNRKRWRVRKCVDGKSKLIGYFKLFEEANDALKKILQQ